eukprot:7591686-Karenia_brevis.AAC.1
MRRSGLCERWLDGADPQVSKLVKGINGPLFEALLKATDDKDAACVELLRKGAMILGKIDCGGI